MDLDEDLNNYNQPTEPVSRVSSPPQRPAPTTAVPSSRTPRISRRTLMGASLVGLAGLGLGGIAAEQWVQHGGLNNLFHGPMASNMQTGHLLRRAGFGASSGDLATYRSLSYSGAVDRLLNYSQVSDDDTENRLKALNLNLGNPVDQQRWWLLRMAWTHLGLSSLVSYTGVANLASQRVLQKVGFSFERALDYEGESCLLYRIHCPARARQ